MMNRRDLLLLALAGVATPARAQQYRTYSRCLPDYLGRLAKEAYETRNQALATIRTAEQVRDRQAWVRKTFWELVGGVPERTPLNLKTISSVDGDGFKLQKLIYESQPQLHIPANLYIPKTGQPPYPGVLFQMGHSLNGKAAEPYQKCCQGLAKLGYLVLAFDPMGQGERTYYPRPGGTLTRLGSADEEHSRPGRQMLLAGDTATRLKVWDAVRSLDVLAAHPLVDPKRLASTGQSGGGTLTMLLAAVDDRLAVAAVSCGNTENFACADFNAPGSVDDAEQNFIGAGPLGFDRWDLLYPFAPKPLLVTVSARDFFGTYSPSYLTSGREEFGKLKRMYSMLSGEDRIEWMESPLPHALSPNMRTAIYNFFERHLRQSNRRVTEPPVKPLPEAELYVGPTGNVVRDFASTTPRQIARSRLAAGKGSMDWRNLLKMGHAGSQTDAVRLGQTQFGEVTVEALEVPSEAGVFLPVWLYLPPAAAAGRSLLLLLEPQGRNARWREDDLYHRLAQAGFAVCAFDIRGIGDLSPEVGRGNPYYTRPHSDEEAYSWASMMLGRPLIGQRVRDVLSMASAMRRYAPLKGRTMVLAARGKMATPALFAGALDESISRLCLVTGLKSYASLMELDDYDEPFANFLPNVLKSKDLPEIEGTLGKRLTKSSSWTYESLAAL